MGSGPAGASMARLLSPTSCVNSSMNFERRGGCFGNGYFATTRHSDFHSLASFTAVQGSVGQARFRDIRGSTRQAMIL